MPRLTAVAARLLDALCLLYCRWSVWRFCRVKRCSEERRILELDCCMWLCTRHNTRRVEALREALRGLLDQLHDWLLVIRVRARRRLRDTIASIIDTACWNHCRLSVWLTCRTRGCDEQSSIILTFCHFKCMNRVAKHLESIQRLLRRSQRKT